MLIILRNKKSIGLLTLILLCLQMAAQDSGQIRQLIQTFKTDERGPYQAIRWFCPDGTVLPPLQRCAEPGGIQHALHRDNVQRLAKEQHLFLGQILAGTPIDDFWDASNQNSRAIQYQLEKYLIAADNGWILRQARFYRGARQAEDEAAWSGRFLNEMLSRTDILEAQFFYIRQLCKDLPIELGRAEEDRWHNIRLLSKNVADLFPEFTGLRVKIHGQPDETDLRNTREFRTRFQAKLLPDVDALLQSLIQEMDLVYTPLDINDLESYLTILQDSTALKTQLWKIIWTYGPRASQPQSNEALCDDLSRLLWLIRSELPEVRPAARLRLMVLSIRLERMLFRTSIVWTPASPTELIQKIYFLAQAAAGCGYLEIWEWQAIEDDLRKAGMQSEMTFAAFLGTADHARRVVEWGTGMMRSTYGQEILRFGQFEPLVNGFFDDRIRGSVLLPLGDSAGEIGELAARFSGISNQVMKIKNQNQIRGINPGFAVGELEVLEELTESFNFSDKKIYVLLNPPADLKPIAGIATVSAGNLVSHVQLLARNLGIPNAVISQQNLADLKPFSGQQVFYAVSPLGKVIMKPLSHMTEEEEDLVTAKKRNDERLKVPTSHLDLNKTELLSLRHLRAGDSGKICGPKAANLGQLKSLFPQRVAEGFIIPFGVFRRHMDQPMPGKGISYWRFLEEMFKEAERKKKAGQDPAEIDTYILTRLTDLRNAISEMPLLPELIGKIRKAFLEILNAEVGEKAVFIRSDTNMEDLPEFTGAGLNLTVFNVLESQAILQAIRDVWSSPYTERSYRWRQKYLLNPENVFPSILILPTVQVDKSGVLITTGVSSSNPNDLTVAFSRGPGGAVDGQAAESYLLRADGTSLLLSPSRDHRYNILPKSGGIKKGYTRFNSRLLQPADLDRLRSIALEIKQKLPGTPGIHTNGPFDVELGFLKNEIVLFQVRPFVENKRARSSMYLNQLDAGITYNTTIRLVERLRGGAAK